MLRSRVHFRVKGPVSPFTHFLLFCLALAIMTAGSRAQESKAAAGEEIQVPPPPFTDGIFPCSECHKDLKPNPAPRQLKDMHDEIVLKHGERGRWCFDCHNPDDRDKLRLASGKLIDFKESYLLCVHCHNPHSPHFKPLNPLPPPVPPEQIQPVKGNKP